MLVCPYNCVFHRYKGTNREMEKEREGDSQVRVKKSLDGGDFLGQGWIEEEEVKAPTEKDKLVRDVSQKWRDSE